MKNQFGVVFVVVMVVVKMEKLVVEGGKLTGVGKLVGFGWERAGELGRRTRAGRGRK